MKTNALSNCENKGTAAQQAAKSNIANEKTTNEVEQLMEVHDEVIH
jgi:hypothetical protein